MTRVRGRGSRGRNAREGRRNPQVDDPQIQTTRVHDAPSLQDPPKPLQSHVPPISSGDYATMAAKIEKTVTKVVTEKIKEIVAEQLAQHVQSQQVQPQQVSMPHVHTQNQNLQDISVKAKHLRDFRIYDPRTFDGSLEDPTNGVLWLWSIETIFYYMKCPDDQKVHCAVFKLTDDAQIWWESVERMVNTNTESITWEQFKEYFYEEYFSTDIRFKKEKEFLELKQGNMTVQQYAQEFNKLSRFAPKMVSTEEERAERFVHGLKGRVRGLVHALNPTTYAKPLHFATLMDFSTDAERPRSLGPRSFSGQKRKLN